MSDKTIEARMAELQEKINEIENRPTEVYSRIVGYYRSVKNWNNGKSAEYKVRRTFMEPEALPAQQGNEEPMADQAAEEAAAVEAAVAVEKALESVEKNADNQADLFSLSSEERALGEDNKEVFRGSYSFFFRQTCPNCPPVKDFLSGLKIKGDHINVDNEDGLNAAVKHNVFTAPTVIIFSDRGEELYRSDNVTGLEEYLSSKKQAVVAS